MSYFNKAWKSNKEYMRKRLIDPSFIFISLFLKIFVMKTKKNNMFFIYFSRPLIHGSKISISLSNISIIGKIQMSIWSTRLRPVIFNPSEVWFQKIGQLKKAIFSLMLRIHMLIGQVIFKNPEAKKKNSWKHISKMISRKRIFTNTNILY